MSAPSIASHPAVQIPESVSALARGLALAGFESWLVGASAHALLAGERPRAFELATSATLDACLDLLPSAVPTQQTLGIVTVPGGDGPIDLVCLGGRALEDDLDHRDFTIFAMACNPASGELIDPHGGRRDLAAGRIRAVGAAAEVLRADPVRSLRAARLVAECGYEVDAELEGAMRSTGSRLRTCARGRKRRELVRILLGPHVSAALDLLRRTGLEARLVKSVRDDAAELAGFVPPILVYRLAAWLRGTRPAGMLRRLRFGVARSTRVERLLANHPLDERITPTLDRSISKLLHQLDGEDIEFLFTLREWELAHVPLAPDRASRARRRLAEVRAGIARVRANREKARQREALALHGREVMRVLDCSPGRRIGDALDHLVTWVAADPARNTEAALRAELVAWATLHPDPQTGSTR